jgi:hypothetical protein
LSTASPLPLQPLPTSTVSEEETRALKQQVTSRLAEHRQRRHRPGDVQPVLPLEGLSPARSRVADSVAARFARSVSYRDFLQQEAEQAIRQAEAAAEVARRSAEAITAAQHQLLDEIDQWNTQDHDVVAGPAEVITFAATAEPVDAVAMAPLRSEAASAETHALALAVSETGLVVETSVHVASVTAVPSEAFRETFHAALGETRAISTFEVQVEEVVAEPVEPSTPLPANLIEFPRQLIAARRARPRLAEGPLRDEADASPERAQLRIFEVEASAVSIEPMMESAVPVWHNIRLDAHAQPRTTEHADAQISFAIPLHVAPASQRLMAASVDACCVTTAFLMAVATAAYTSPVLPTGILAVAASAGTLFLFAMLYQVLFFSLSGVTPGMRYARIALCTFADENPTRSAMRRRIFALLLAGAPAGLGLIWACMDEEKLGWHDRISRMYPRAY